MPGFFKNGRRSRAIPGFLAAAALLIALAAAQPAKADYALLRRGQRLHITGWQNLGDKVRLGLPVGGVTFSLDKLALDEPEEGLGASAHREAEGTYSFQIQNTTRTYGLDDQLIYL